MLYLGEGTVYTVGSIGVHKAVSTKLPRIGHGEGAMIAAGSTVTRLLGKTVINATSDCSNTLSSVNYILFNIIIII